MVLRVGPLPRIRYIGILPIIPVLHVEGLCEKGRTTSRASLREFHSEAFIPRSSSRGLRPEAYKLAKMSVYWPRPAVPVLEESSNF